MDAELHTSLRQQQHGLIRQLSDCLESHWRKYFDLAPYPLPPGLHYIQGTNDGEKIVIENICYQSSAFRKLHIELARVGSGLDILHCVMFPRTQYPLPIFGTDLVVASKGVSAAIVDLSPVNSELKLPHSYIQALSSLPTINFSRQRSLPDWGDIFSRFCLFIRPINPQEETLFLQRVEQYLAIHCQLAISTAKCLSLQQQAEIRHGHQYYCNKQRQNDKTRRILEHTFGREWAAIYMNKVLFDCVA